MTTTRFQGKIINSFFLVDTYELVQRLIRDVFKGVGLVPG